MKKKIISLLLIVLTLGLLPKSVLAIEVTDEHSLKEAIANGKKDITLVNDIILITDEQTHTTRKVGLDVRGEGNITINGNGHKLSTLMNVAIELRAQSGKTLTVQFNDITIEAKDRAIDTRSSGINLELNRVNLSVVGSGNVQGLTIGGNAERIGIMINNSNINAGNNGYGIITFNPVNMTITNSKIIGYSALYMKPADSSVGSNGSVVSINNSNLVGNNAQSGDYNNFGTIVLADKNIKIDVVDTTIIANNTLGTSIQTPILQSSEIAQSVNANNTVTIAGTSELLVNTQNDYQSIAVNDNGLTLTVSSGVKSNIMIDEKYVEVGAVVVQDINGNNVVVLKRNIMIVPDEHGVVTTDKNEAVAGDEVTISATPKTGYEVKNIKVIDENDNEISVLNNKFIMPNQIVRVITTFELINPNTSDISIGALSTVFLISIVSIGFFFKQIFKMD